MNNKFELTDVSVELFGATLFQIKEFNYFVCEEGFVYNKKFKQLKGFSNGKGYLQVDLYKDGKPNRMSVHRIIANVFHGLNISNKNICALHKNDNPTNNRKDNIFIGSHKENMIDRHNKKRDTWLGKKYGEHNCSVNIAQMKDGMIINTFTSMKKAGEYIGLSYVNISKVCRGLRKTAGGFEWRYI